MVNITLKGGVVKEYESGITPLEIAKGLGMGLYKAACAANIDGENCDLRTPINKDCEVQILSYRTGTVGDRTTYTTDSSLAPGATKVIQSGSNGATSVTYKILKQNGQEISREIVSRDTYQPHNQIIARGN